MKALMQNNHSEKLFWNIGWSEVNEKIQEYILEEMKEISGASSEMQAGVSELCKILKKARELGSEVAIFGSKQDYHIISHANVDFIKMNNLKIVNIGIPEMTAFGNDYPYPFNLSEFLSRRKFGNGSVLIGINLGESSRLLEEAFKHNSINNGINVLISNNYENQEDVHLTLRVDTKNRMIAGDITQMILHYVSANIAFDTDTAFTDEGASRFGNYCELLDQSIESSLFSKDKLSEISLIIRERLLFGNSVFAFGNGGSSSIASYFSEGLRDVCTNMLKTYGKIFDLAAFAGNITYSIEQGYFKNDVFTKTIRELGTVKGDILFGVSTSGNSGNIIHPFTNINEAVRIGILGFDDGGALGQSDVKDIAFIVPDAGGYRSYQRAEDGQRMAVSAIISTFLYI